MTVGSPIRVDVEDPFAIPGTTSSIQVNIYNSPYDARPDGSDVASLIESAIADVDALGGGTVIIPEFDFAVSTVVVNVSNRVTISGGGTLTQLVGSALLPVVSIISSGVTIDGLRITGSIAAGHEADEGTSCILLTYVGAPITLDGIRIRNCYMTGKNGGIFTYNGAAAFSLSDLVIERNTVRTLHWGIFVGPYAVDAVVNDRILVQDNDIEVTAIGGYASFIYARPMQIINTNNLTIRNNRSIGGFSGIETYGGFTAPRPHQHNVRIHDNVTDGHIGFTQVDGGYCGGNAVDLTFRDGSWPTYDNATLVAMWGFLPGIEAADITDCVVAHNVVRNQVGEGIQFGAAVNCQVSNNVIKNSGATASVTLNSHGIGLVFSLTDCLISDNQILTAKNSGIALEFDATYLAVRTTIRGNRIRGVAQHGITLHYSDGCVLADNNISLFNQPPSGYNGIDFLVISGADVVRDTMIRANRIDDSGTYGIYQPHFESNFGRGVVIEGNLVKGAFTAPYNCYGRRARNLILGAVATPSFGLTATHLDTTNLQDVLVLDPGGAATLAFIDGGHGGNEVLVEFGRADTLVAQSANINLSGSVNVTPTSGSIMTFVCILETTVTNQIWREVSRMIA